MRPKSVSSGLIASNVYGVALVVPITKLMEWDNYNNLLREIWTLKNYCIILKNKMLPSLKTSGRNVKFQHDKDPKQIAKISSQFLSSKKSVCTTLAQHITRVEPNRAPVGSIEEES